jgi:Holliday junction resolvase RusA-like endonuclease
VIVLEIDGPPRGKARPRFVKETGRTYTPSATIHAEDRIRAAWERVGSITLEGPVRLDLTVVVARPGGHFKVDGTLSKAGVRAGGWPVKRPDLDNCLKLVADALNGCAYKDDAQIAQATLRRRWADPGEREHTIVEIYSLPAGGVHVLGRAAA